MRREAMRREAMRREAMGGRGVAPPTPELSLGARSRRVPGVARAGMVLPQRLQLQ